MSALTIKNHALTTSDKARALRAIEEVHAAYFVKGGMRDAINALEKKAENTAQLIYALAVHATKQHKTLLKAAEHFAAMCRHAEEDYKEKHNASNMQEALPVWPVYKSNIMRGFREGLSPLEYPTEYDLRKAWQAMLPPVITRERQAMLPPPKKGGKASSEQVMVEDWLQATGVFAKLSHPAAELIVRLEHIPRPNVTAAEAVIKRALDDLRSLVA